MKAIVTGHSRGLGQALTLELLARGVTVLGLARAGIEAVPHDARLQQARIDLADSAALGALLRTPLVAAFADTRQPLLLINNAATAGPLGYAGSAGPAQVARALALNVQAPLMLSERVLAATRSERRLMHVSSGAAVEACAAWSIYCASKAALDQHARALWLESRQARPWLRVASVSPGVIDTDMQHALRQADGQCFPLQADFRTLHRHGQLQAPRACARRLVDLMLDPRYGEVPVLALPSRQGPMEPE